MLFTSISINIYVSTLKTHLHKHGNLQILLSFLKNLWKKNITKHLLKKKKNLILNIQRVTQLLISWTIRVSQSEIVVHLDLESYQE